MPPSQLNFLTTVPGLDFTLCWSKRIVVDIDGIAASYLSKPDLIAAKRTAGRAQNLADLEELQRPLSPGP